MPDEPIVMSYLGIALAQPIVKATPLLSYQLECITDRSEKTATFKIIPLFDTVGRYALRYSLVGAGSAPAQSSDFVSGFPQEQEITFVKTAEESKIITLAFSNGAVYDRKFALYLYDLLRGNSDRPIGCVQGKVPTIIV